MTAPASWGHPDLQNYYKLRPTFTARSATRALPSSTSTSTSAKSNKKNIGAIAGGTIGGLVALIAILCLILFCLHRRKKAAKKNEEAPPGPPAQPPAELDNTTMPHEMSSTHTSKYMTVREQPDPSIHTSRTISHEFPSPYPIQLPPSYGASSPSTPAAINSSPDQSYAHHSRQPSDPELFYPEAGHNDALNIWDRQSHSTQSQLSPRQYSYPTPTSPLQQNPPMPVAPQPQVYYPPPMDPTARSQRSQPSFSDRRGSPAVTHHSRDVSPAHSPNVSTTATPAQFYTQPASNSYRSPG